MMSATSIAPLAHLSYLYTLPPVLRFVGEFSGKPLSSVRELHADGSVSTAPVVPSLLAYVAGLVFYATHFPECVLSSPGQVHWLDWLGGGSHAIWHVCIVIAISLHRNAMDHMKLGIRAAPQ